MKIGVALCLLVFAAIVTTSGAAVCRKRDVQIVLAKCSGCTVDTSNCTAWSACAGNCSAARQSRTCSQSGTISDGCDGCKACNANATQMKNCTLSGCGTVDFDSNFFFS